MADNSSIPVAVGNETFANKDLAGVKYPRAILADTAGNEVLGTKTDAANTATDTTSVSVMSVLKQLSVSIQALAGIVTSSKGAVKAASGDFADGALATIGTKTDAKSTATDATSASGISIWKQISASAQALAAIISGGKLQVQAFIDASTVNANGMKTPGNSAPVVHASQTYETVAASQTDQVMGSTGAIGDWLDFVLIIPANTSPGAVSIKDGSGSAITIFTGGATSVGSLVPFAVPVKALCTGVGWKITTGASVSAIGVGNFT